MGVGAGGVVGEEGEEVEFVVFPLGVFDGGPAADEVALDDGVFAADPGGAIGVESHEAAKGCGEVGEGEVVEGDELGRDQHWQGAVVVEDESGATDFVDVGEGG